jgi:hypothetical protein
MMKVKRKPSQVMEMMLKKMENLEGHWNPPQIFVTANLHQSIFFMICYLFFVQKIN